MRHLPDEHNRKQGPCFRRSSRPCAAAQPIIGGIAPGHRADQRVGRADTLERRVSENVNRDRDRGEKGRLIRCR